MTPLLPPIEKPAHPMLKLGYLFTRKQFGTVPGPLSVFCARMPFPFTRFYGNLSKLDKKLSLPADGGEGGAPGDVRCPCEPLRPAPDLRGRLARRQRAPLQHQQRGAQHRLRRLLRGPRSSAGLTGPSRGRYRRWGRPRGAPAPACSRQGWSTPTCCCLRRPSAANLPRPEETPRYERPVVSASRRSSYSSA